MSGFPLGGSCQRPRPLTDEGRPYRNNPFTGGNSELCPHQPPAGGSFHRRGKPKKKKHPHGANHAGAYFLCQYQPNILIRIPAATAEPITPATMGPLAARVSQKVGKGYNQRNSLLMHGMGPQVSGVVGLPVAAGILINMFGGY